MKKILTLLLFTTIPNYLLSQGKDVLSIKVELISKDNFVLPSDINYYPFHMGPGNEHDYHFAKLEIFNNGDTVLPVTIWTCSWNWNWKSNNDSIFIYGWGCDGNYPDNIKIPPKKSLCYYTNIYVKPGTKNTCFKMGFATCYRNFDDIYWWDWGKNPTEPQGKFYWSDPIYIYNHL
jgi:hypothetical protein